MYMTDSVCPHSQDLFAGSSQQDGAGFRVFTLRDEGEVLITDLLHLKQTRTGPYVFLTQLISPTDDTSPACPDTHTHRLKTCLLRADWLQPVR